MDDMRTIQSVEDMLPICRDIISMYCTDNDIREKNIHPVIWSDILDEIYRQLILPNKKILLKADNAKYNEYDNDKVLYVYNIYKKLCKSHIQEISFQGFVDFSGIEKQTILNWRDGGASQNRIDLHKKIVEDNERSLSDLMIGDKGLSTKYLAKLNRYHDWNLPGVSREKASAKALGVDALPKLGQNTVPVVQIEQIENGAE